MSRHLVWYAEQCNTALVVAVLTVLFLFPDRNDQSPVLVRRSDTRLPYGSQDRMQPMDHGCTSSFDQLHTSVARTSCFSTPQLCHSLSDLVKRGWGFLSR